MKYIENVINIPHCILYTVKKTHKIHPQVSISELMKQRYQHLGIPFITLRMPPLHTPFPNHEFINLFAFLYSFTTFAAAAAKSLQSCPTPQTILLFSFACFWILYRWNHTVLTLLCNLLLCFLSVMVLKFIRVDAPNCGSFVLLCCMQLCDHICCYC